MRNSIGLMLTVIAMQSAIPVFAASAEEKATYIAANDKAETDYKLARTHCDRLNDNAKSLCIAQAKAAQIKIESNATAVYEDTPVARATARIDIADANYDVDKVKCESQFGNSRDVCSKKAEATMVAEKADATADKKISEARSDANGDKQAVNYSVAIEKCAALVGAHKDDCVVAARKQFEK